MIKPLIILLASTTFAIGVHLNLKTPLETDAYVKRFESLYGKTDVTIEIVDTIGIDEPDPKIVGYCFPMQRLVQLQRAYWNQGSEINREIVVFHELGHCQLKREHTYHAYEDNCPISVMNPVLPNAPCYQKHYTDYINELSR